MERIKTKRGWKDVTPKAKKKEEKQLPTPTPAGDINLTSGPDVMMPVPESWETTTPTLQTEARGGKAAAVLGMPAFGTEVIDPTGDLGTVKLLTSQQEELAIRREKLKEKGSDDGTGIVQSVNETGGHVIEFKGLGTSITLTDEQYEQWARFRRRGSIKHSDPIVAKALQDYQVNKTAGLQPNMMVAPDIEQRNIWASTFREGLGLALSKGLLGAAAGAVIGAPAGGIGAIPGALIGFFGTAIASLYSSYTGNQKEEVANAFKGFQGLKTGISAQLTAVRAGALSSSQAMVNLNYAAQRLSYYESLLRQKQAGGGFIADVSDYDGKMAYMIEYRNLYFSAIRAQIMAALANSGYMPQEIFIPDFEEDI